MNTLQRFFRLAAPFWFGKSQWREWLLLAAVVGFSLFIVRVGVWITGWNKTFYDALAAFHGQAMPALVAEFLVYIALITASVAVGNRLRKILLLRWREHLSRNFEYHWLGGHKHYRLQITAEPDNPDQRIAEDIYLLCEKSIDLFKYFIMNAAKLGAFVSILWQISGTQVFQFGGRSFTVYGYLVWIALFWSLFCTLLTHLIGRKLQGLNIERQHREADYRAALLRVRDHSGQIALYSGETAEQGRLNIRFSRIKHNWHALIAREMKLEAFSAAYLRLSMFIPIIATLPMYLAHTMTFGGMMQARSAFSNVQDGFGWFMDYYKRIIEWAAVVERLAQFQTALNNLPAQTAPPPPASTANSGLSIGNLSIRTAEGRPLLGNVSFEAPAGAWLLLDGRSGIGKSTLLRTLAGLWPYYSGGWQLAPNARTLFLPQRPYLPQDSLRAAACYPFTATYGDKAVKAALQQVGLGRLNNDLDTVQEWQRILSGGEQQRLSLARALLACPDLLFLDEATGQLDNESARQLMQDLKRLLPHTLCVAVSHQPEVKALFPLRLDLNPFSQVR